MPDPKDLPQPPYQDPMKAMQKAQRIYSDPQAQRRADFAQQHPWIQKAADFLTGGATAEPAAERPGPADVMMAMMPFAGTFKSPFMKAAAQTPSKYLKLIDEGAEQTAPHLSAAKDWTSSPSMWGSSVEANEPKITYGLSTGSRTPIVNSEEYLQQLNAMYGPREARAQQMGFTRPVYHGTRADVDYPEFDPNTKLGDWGIHVTPTPDTAGRAISVIDKGGNPVFSGDIVPPEARARTIPLRAKITKEFHMPDVGNWKRPGSWVNKLEDYGGSIDKPIFDATAHKTNDPAVLQELFEAAHRRTQIQDWKLQDEGWGNEVTQILQKHGYDAITYPNYYEGLGEPSHLLLSGSQLRVPHAAFDPKKANLANLTAGVAGVAAAPTVKENMQDILDRYRRTR